MAPIQFIAQNGNTYSKFIIGSILVVLCFASFQIFVVLDVSISELTPLMYVVPIIVGSTFGFMLGTIRVLQKQLQVNLKKISESEQELSDEVFDRKMIEKSLIENQEDLLRIITDLKAFSSAISHDLRAPIQSIQNYTLKLLEEHGSELDEEIQRYIQHVSETSTNMKNIIDALLDLAKASHSSLNIIDIDLAELSTTVFHELDPELTEKVNLILEPDLKISADIKLMYIVMANLLSNACKFSRSVEEATIRIGHKTTTEGEAIYVSDNGAGFDVDNMENLFDSFKRLHSDDEYPGTGIGLATVNRIIERHGGNVWAEGEMSKGATFYFTLPT